MSEILASVVIIALVAFLLAVAMGSASAEKPPLYWSLVFITGCCAVVAISISI